MPFEKGNTLWKEGLKAKKENKLLINELMSIAVSGGFSDYVNKLDQLSKKKELTKQELEFMDRLEKLFEYAVPKLARTEMTGKDGKDIKGILVYLPQKNGVETTPDTGEGPDK